MISPQPPFDVISRKLQPLHSFYRWWLMTLAAVMTKAPLKSRPWDVLLLHGEHGMGVFTRHSGSIVRIAEIPAADAASRIALPANPGKHVHVVLRLSAEQVLERHVQIPKAASDVMEPVLRNQMSRMVPWPQHETSYGFEIVEGGANALEQLDIRVVATTKAVLDAGLARARALGVAPSVVDYAAPDALNTGMELMSLAGDPRERIARRLHRGAIALLVASLTIGGIGFLGSRQSAQEERSIDARIAAARARLDALSSLGAESTKHAEAVAPLVARKASEPAIVVLIDALSRALPDSAHLTELEIRGGQIRLLGQSREATALIGQIESTPQFESVQFAAPTVRDAGAGLESFTIAARAIGAASGRKEDDDAQ